MIDEMIVNASEMKEIDLDRLSYNLERYHFSVLRGLVDSDSVRLAMSKVKEFVACNEDSATTGEDPSQVRDYFMKMSIGNAKHGGVERPRFKRAIYNPLDKEDKFGLHSSFKCLARVRNLLMNQDTEFAIDKDELGVWTAARMHHFPAGGGFMVKHYDTVLPSMLKQQRFEGGFYQPLLLLSQKGLDFDVGGGFAMVNGDMIEYEDYTQLGDIVIYDSQTEHGVNDIDPNKKFNQRSGKGRYSGLVSLYKVID